MCEQQKEGQLGRKKGRSLWRDADPNHGPWNLFFILRALESY